MPSQLKGRKVAFLATDGVEQVELTAPWNALKQAGADVVLVSDKPVEAICHGPWLLVEADALRGRTITSWPSLETDVRNAGGAWVDKQVQVDQKLLTSRKPDDLPAFCARLVELLADAIDERRLDKMVEQSFPASDPLPGPIALG